MEGKELNFEKEINKYIYRDNFDNHRVVFECIAGSILEADEKYKSATGFDVSKQVNIACSIESAENEIQNNLLKTEGGMFQLEISDKIKDAYELIEISTVDDSVKVDCMKIFEELVKEAKARGEKADVYEICRVALIKLDNILVRSSDDNEKEQLFEGLKGVILNARNSAKGWKTIKSA